MLKYVFYCNNIALKNTFTCTVPAIFENMDVNFEFKTFRFLKWK